MGIPETITCVDCLSTCHRLGHPPHEGYQPGDVVAYRCEACMDRWDIVLEAEDMDPDESTARGDNPPSV